MYAGTRRGFLDYPTLSFKHTPFIPGYRSQNFYSSIHHDALPLVSVLVLPL